MRWSNKVSKGNTVFIIYINRKYVESKYQGKAKLYITGIHVNTVHYIVPA